MVKKFWAFTFILALAGGLFMGCSSKKSGITLKCMEWADVEEAKIMQGAVDEFKKAHPGVEVELDRVPYNEYITKVLSQFAADLTPDVMAVNAEQLVSFSSRGILVDLKPYVDKDPSLKLADFYPEALNHYTVDGQLQALPRDIAPIAVIYYNKKKFDEAGLAYPKNSWTQAEFLVAARKLTKKDATGKVLQFGFVDDWSIWDAWVYADGGSVVDNERK